MRYAKLYTKVFLAAGIPYGICMGVFCSFIEFPIGTIIGLLSGAFFGGMMSLLLVSLHILKARRIASGDVHDIVRVRHARDLDLPMPYDEAFEKCIRSLGCIRGTKIREQDLSRGTIEAKTRMTFWSFGEILAFNVQRVDQGRTRVRVLSRPALTTTLVDCGKSLQNMQAIVGFLTQPHESP